jgi:type 1 glutamine amidotransferase
MRAPLLGLVVCFAFGTHAFAQDRPVYEDEPKDPGAIKSVLMAGPPSAKTGAHEYRAGCEVLARLLRQTPGVFPVLVRDGWPTKPQTLQGARTLIFFHDGGDVHALLKGDRMAQVQKLVEGGTGLVAFHQTIDFPKDAAQRAIHWFGGVWQKGTGQRAHWIASFDVFPQHPVTGGVSPFKVDDGWLYRDRFLADKKGITPLLRTVSPKAPPGSLDKDDAIVSWLYDRPDGGRSFVFTGCHLHSSWAIDGYRELLVNGILWTAKVEIPTGGAAASMQGIDLKANLEPRAAKTK